MASALSLNELTNAVCSSWAAIQSGDGLRLAQSVTLGTRHFVKEKSPTTCSFAKVLQKLGRNDVNLVHGETAC